MKAILLLLSITCCICCSVDAVSVHHTSRSKHNLRHPTHRRGADITQHQTPTHLHPNPDHHFNSHDVKIRGVEMDVHKVKNALTERLETETNRLLSVLASNLVSRDKRRPPRPGHGPPANHRPPHRDAEDEDSSDDTEESSDESSEETEFDYYGDFGGDYDYYDYYGDYGDDYDYDDEDDAEEKEEDHSENEDEAGDGDDSDDDGSNNDEETVSVESENSDDSSGNENSDDDDDNTNGISTISNVENVDNSMGDSQADKHDDVGHWESDAEDGDPEPDQEHSAHPTDPEGDFEILEAGDGVYVVIANLNTAGHALQVVNGSHVHVFHNEGEE